MFGSILQVYIETHIYTWMYDILTAHVPLRTHGQTTAGADHGGRQTAQRPADCHHGNRGQEATANCLLWTSQNAKGIQI